MAFKSRGRYLRRPTGGVLRHHAHQEAKHRPPAVVDLIRRSEPKDLRILNRLVVGAVQVQVDA